MRLILSMLLALTLGLPGVGCLGTAIVIEPHRGNPGPYRGNPGRHPGRHARPRIKRPSPHHHWVDGHYKGRGHHKVWVPGHWKR